jgi:5'(3')-deoxyribonucleotidase
MIIAIDIDDTIANLSDAWLRRYNYDFNDNLKKKNITKWAVHEFVKPECGTKIYDYLKDPTLYDFIQPIPDSLEAVEFLRNFGRVIFITAPTLETMGRKYYWLKEHHYIDSLDDYIETKEKYLIKYDYIIDDRYDNVKDSNNNYLYNQSWNIKYNHHNRIKSWKTFIEEKSKELWRG